MKILLFAAAAAALCAFAFQACKQEAKQSDTAGAEAFVSPSQVDKTIRSMTDSLGEAQSFRIERGVKQVAALWHKEDGDLEAFNGFCKKEFKADTAELDRLFNTLERNFELLNGYFHKIDVALKEPLQLEGPDINDVDMIFGSYDVTAHLGDDLYANKIAFITALNFPFYSLEEKSKLGEEWIRKEWAYARMGDRFSSRVPAAIQQEVSKTLTEADAYISDYNIYMGRLLNEKGEKLFPEGMKLITHWGLRDELKSNYADALRGLEKQRMVYAVMKRIIDQSIPQLAVNKGDYDWNPIDNKLYDAGKEIEFKPEQNTRYEVFLGNFHAMRKLDAYESHFPTQLARAFEVNMEIPQQDVETLFKSLLSSPQVKQVAAFIESRLGRKLEPFDIWYNGFRGRSNIAEDELTALTSKKYPNPAALKNDLTNILLKLGWNADKAAAITKLISVDPSRGAGHAWGATMRNDQSRLRTRIGADGMDYKGYNIAVHEFGHNVEQTITMNDVDYYSLTGVPNTAFTEAVAFLFQKKDLELLGLKQANPEDDLYLALDNFWSCYEIMGVSLLDIAVWEWLYAHPQATAAELKEAVMAKAKEIWNTYYADVLGGKDETLLAIYSHMIDYPLYLPNYPVGHLINFQIEQQVEGKNLASEMDRMFTVGRLVPQLWMQKAVNSKISIEPTIKATEHALQVLGAKTN